MREKFTRFFICMLLLQITLAISAFKGNKSALQTAEKPFLGRWDINVLGSDSGYINRARFCWLEVKMEDGILKGRLQPGEGATVDVTDLKIENGQLSFNWKARSLHLHLVKQPVPGQVYADRSGLQSCQNGNQVLRWT
jgi:hypothetical protein